MALLCAALVAGCSDSENRFAFDGKYFRTKVKRVDKQRDVFVATVKGVSQSFEGARGPRCTRQTAIAWRPMAVPTSIGWWGRTRRQTSCALSMTR
ncbi:hypothetical protein ACFQFQ_08475 [Sulfitobacter porphyrae]|uniref:Lipoprotein n=1 Tax=Sulfitobacter porphyrae TaxID=1246864 RepID=A0ABW2B3P4_9RHOB